MEEQAFLNVIADKWEDDDVRLIYADWLEERADPRAEFLRLECRLAMLSPDDGGCQPLPNRFLQIGWTCDRHWLASVSRVKFWESAIDPLTGLPNRQGFQQLLVAEYEGARSLHLPLSVLALDLDRFGEINQRYFLPGGDQVLGEVASLISSAARPGDVVVRDGGDQFSLVLPGTDGEKACREAERIRLAVVSATVRVRGEPVPLTVSVGVATATFEEAEAWELFLRARSAVHRAKDSGRNRVAMA